MLALLSAVVLYAQVQARPDSVRPDSARRDSIQADSSKGKGKARKKIPLTPALLRSAFTDEQARQLVATARAARLRQDSALISYDATTYTRISAGLRIAAIGRDRLAFRMENASRVRWHRDAGLWVDVKGQRMVIPIVKLDPSDIDDDDISDMAESAAIPYFPGREPLFFMGNAMAKAEINENEFIHPLADGAEAYYRYSSGDSIAIKLGGGRTIRVQEIKVRARTPTWNLSVGSIWVDRETGQFVRCVFRLSEKMDIWAVAQAEDSTAQDDIPMLVKPMISPMRADITSVTIEYGLYEGRFWLPRVQTAEGDVQVSFMRVPTSFVNTFTYASVNGLDSLPKIVAQKRTVAGQVDATDSARRANDPYYRMEDSVFRVMRDSMLQVPQDSAKIVSISIGMGARVSKTTDTTAVNVRARQEARDRLRSVRRKRVRQCDTSTVEVITTWRYDNTVPVAMKLPCDRKSLETSADLPASIYDPGEEVYDADSRKVLLDAIGLGTQSSFAPQRPIVKWGLGEGLLRYNRVEGLAPAVMIEERLGAGYTATALARFGLADRQLTGEIGAMRSNGRKDIGVAAYRRLAYSNLFGDPHTFGASMAGLFFGRDEGLYYRTLGAEMRGLGHESGMFTWRVFVQQERNASVHTQASLPNLLGAYRFIDNIRATDGTFGGFESRFHISHGEDPRALRLLTDARFDVVGGTSTFIKTSADMTVSRAVSERIDAGLTASGGIALGEPPVQRLYFLGGSQTVRGQAPAAAAGTLYWLGRAEVGRAYEWYRPTLFADVGWAGDRLAWKNPGRPLSGAGVGVSILDGMFRADLARGFYPQKQWRLELYLEARF